MEGTEARRANLRRRRGRHFSLPRLSVLLTSPQCAIVASIVTGAIAWPQDPSTPAPPWITRASWYSSLILGLTAISSATQQSLTLYRLGYYEDCLSRLRHILGQEHRRKDGSTVWTVRWAQMVVWQIPVMLLNFSILLFVSGLLVLLRAKAIQAGDQLSHDDVKVRTSDFS